MCGRNRGPRMCSNLNAREGGAAQADYLRRHWEAASSPAVFADSCSDPAVGSEGVIRTPITAPISAVNIGNSLHMPGPSDFSLLLLARRPPFFLLDALESLPAAIVDGVVWDRFSQLLTGLTALGQETIGP